MDLYLSTYIFAAILMLTGIAFLVTTNIFEKYAFAFLRSTKAAIVTFGGGGLWFLYIISNLGESDFGNIKNYLLIIFGVAGILSFFYLNDFLSVRGLSVLTLLLAREFIDSAFMQDPTSRLTLVSLSYVAVVAAIYLGAIPYRLRDFFVYLFEKQTRAKTFGLILCLSSVALLISSTMY